MVRRGAGNGPTSTPASASRKRPCRGILAGMNDATPYSKSFLLAILTSALAVLAAPPVLAESPENLSFMRAHFIDVGQGDATLLDFPCAAVLVDAGAPD